MLQAVDQPGPSTRLRQLMGTPLQGKVPVRHADLLFLPRPGGQWRQLFPLQLTFCRGRKDVARASNLLERVGLNHRSQHKPAALSVGEQQRVAIARALVGLPNLILADEPTGQLDTITGSNIIALLREISRKTGITMIIASHDPKVEEAVDLVFEMNDGELVPVTA